MVLGNVLILFFCMWLSSFSQHHLLKKLSLLHCIFLPLLSKIDCRYVSLFLGSLFCSTDLPICLCWCQWVKFWLLNTSSEDTIYHEVKKSKPKETEFLGLWKSFAFSLNHSELDPFTQLWRQYKLLCSLNSWESFVAWNFGEQELSLRHNTIRKFKKHFIWLHLLRIKLEFPSSIVCATMKFIYNYFRKNKSKF